MKRFIPTVSQKSAEGKVGHAVGKDMEALQGRKAEQPIGRAGNDDRRPERYPARGIKGKASEQRDLRDDRRQKKPILFGLAEASRGEAPRGIQEGTESPSGDALCRKPGYFTPSSTRRTAVCGPACTVVWEGRTGDCPPYPDCGLSKSGRSRNRKAGSRPLAPISPSPALSSHLRRVPDADMPRPAPHGPARIPPGVRWQFRGGRQRF